MSYWGITGGVTGMVPVGGVTPGVEDLANFNV